ncbi:unnamed protein product, partial [Staurois parvus]
MLLPGPVFGPCTALRHAALSLIATLCHVPLSGLLTLLVGSIFVIIGCWADLRASHCCCQARNLSWGPPVPPPHAADQARKSVMGPCRPPFAVSPSPLCHVPLSGLLTLLVGYIF